MKELRLDLTTVEKVEIVLRNLPNLKKLNDKEIKPDLFYEDNINENNTNDIELPDSNIESEISNYDVSCILFNFNYI